jgi:hypothetical protein
MTNPGSSETEPELVTIRTFGYESEAMVAKSALQSAGIECVISADDCGGLRPALSLTQGLRLVVKVRDAIRANEILAGQTQKSRRTDRG